MRIYRTLLGTCALAALSLAGAYPVTAQSWRTEVAPAIEPVRPPAAPRKPVRAPAAPKAKPQAAEPAPAEVKTETRAVEPAAPAQPAAIETPRPGEWAAEAEPYDPLLNARAERPEEAPLTTQGVPAQPETTGAAAGAPAAQPQPAQPQTAQAQAQPAQAQPVQAPAAGTPTAQAPDPAQQTFAPPPVDRSTAAQYCANIADAAIDARIAWQRQNLAEAERQIQQRTAELEAKTAEYQRWLARRDEFAEKAKNTVVGIYTKMRPDAAAAQLQVLDEETAAAVLIKLDARIASAVMNEMEPTQAARLTAIISGAAKGPAPRPRQPPAGNRS